MTENGLRTAIRHKLLAPLCIDEEKIVDSSGEAQQSLPHQQATFSNEKGSPRTWCR